tara:strand:+ start:273 stop:482 length:210 start_codon:yes stop_codon:yes gene_type:complete
MKNDFNLDEERKKSDAKLSRYENEDRAGKKYELKLNPLEITAILIFILAVSFIIYSEIGQRISLGFGIG